jgi:hypothetical protein
LFTSQFKSERTREIAKVDWWNALQAEQLSEEAIASAIDWVQRNETRPPNLPRFIEVCRMFKPHAAHQPHQPLPKLKGTWAERQGRARREISKMRALLGG